MASFNNVSLYIKRADLYCTKDYIINAFSKCNIGIIKDVMFIKKTDGSGRDYNGAIVIFERWFMNAKVTKLLDDMNSSENGTTKFVYDNNGHYWFINVHKPVLPESECNCEQVARIDQTLSDKQRIIELEKLTNSMAAQLHYMQLRQEKTERQLMDIEEKESHNALRIMGLQIRLEEKDDEIAWLKEKHEKVLKEAKEDLEIDFGKMSISELA